VARYAPAALVAALLVATGLAFLHTESLKLETSPIRQTRVTKLFSPVCRCNTSKARIAFRVAKPDVVSVSIVDTSGSDVRTLVSEKPAIGRVAFLWNGRDDDGAVVADGSYRARVRLDLIEKTFLLPNLIRIDTRRPVTHVVSVEPRVFSPDGDRRSDRVTVRYTVDERAQGTLYVDGIRLVVGASRKQAGELRWFGMVDGRSLPARSYALTVVTVDAAGNRSSPVDAGPVRIRYLELVSPRLTAVPGGVVRVRVTTDAARVRWRLGKRSGIGRVPVFRFRAPAAPGRYLLVVSAHGHRAGATVVVAER
jgi:flagellar hook capping protein FlgD